MLLFRLKSAIDKVSPETCRKRMREQLSEARPRLYIALAAALIILAGSVFDFGGYAVLTGIAWIILVAAGLVLSADYGSLISDLRFFGPGTTRHSGKIVSAGKEIVLVTFSTGDYERTWQIPANEKTEFTEGQTVSIAWRDEKIQYAALIGKDGKLTGLSRSFSRKKSARLPETDFTSLHCPSCGGPVPLAETAVTNCSFCNAEVPVSVKQRAALAASVKIAEANQQIVAEWKSLSDIRISTWLYRLLNMLPFLLIAAGLGMLLLDSLHLLEGKSPWLALVHRPAVKIGYWGLVIVFTILGAVYSARNLWADDTRNMMLFFAARRPENRNQVFSCRNCGSPLPLREQNAYCVCAYCSTENFILPEAERLEGLESRSLAFSILLEDTVQLCRIRRSSGRFFSIGRGLVLGAMALPLYFLYDGSGIRKPDAWTFAVAADIWFLGICAYWIFREAWLPPVKDQDWLPAGFAQAVPKSRKPARSAAGFSTEKQNFLVPLLLVLLYAAAEICISLS